MYIDAAWARRLPVTGCLFRWYTWRCCEWNGSSCARGSTSAFVVACGIGIPADVDIDKDSISWFDVTVSEVTVLLVGWLFGHFLLISSSTYSWLQLEVFLNYSLQNWPYNSQQMFSVAMVKQRWSVPTTAVERWRADAYQITQLLFGKVLFFLFFLLQ